MRLSSLFRFLQKFDIGVKLDSESSILDFEFFNFWSVNCNLVLLLINLISEKCLLSWIRHLDTTYGIRGIFFLIQENLNCVMITRI